MSKFKVGDRVRGISRAIKGYEGVVVEVDTGSSGDKILCRFKNLEGHNGNGVTRRGKDYDTSDHWYVYPNEIELISRPNETIVIYRKDDKVIAIDKRTGKKTEAKCHPDDKFNFETGAKLAFERLLEEPEKKEERYYNGKIIFTKGDHVFFKTGHIYEIIDGKFANTKLPVGYAFKSLQDIKDYFTADSQRQPKWSSHRTLKFIEVLDD